MSSASVDPRGSALRYAIAQLLCLLLIASCAAEPDRSVPTVPETADQPRVTSTLPQQTPSPPPQLSPTPPPTATIPSSEPSPESETARRHVVETGDTLLELAQRYAVPMAAIQRANGMGESTILRAGETLTVPSAIDWEGASPYWRLYEVTTGETLIGIAQAHDVDIQTLRDINDLEDADRIVLGQQLILPVTNLVLSRSPTVSTTTEPTAAALPTAEPSLTSTTSQETAAAEAPSSRATPVAGAAAPRELESWPQEIARLINEVRADHGLPPFTYHGILEQAAQAHANDCAARGWCSHTGSDGANIKTRVFRAGYEGSSWAECWAQSQNPQRSVDIWMDEVPPNDPHRRTLLSDWFTEIGIGVSDAGWGYYIIANFGRR